MVQIPAMVAAAVVRRVVPGLPGALIGQHAGVSPGVSSHASQLHCSALRLLQDGHTTRHSLETPCLTTGAAKAPFGSTSCPGVEDCKSPVPSSKGLLLSRYHALIDSGALRPDPKQADTVSRLQELSDQLEGFKRRVETYNQEVEVYKVRVCVCVCVLDGVGGEEFSTPLDFTAGQTADRVIPPACDQPEARREAFLQDLKATEAKDSGSVSQPASNPSSGLQILQQLWAVTGLGGGQSQQTSLSQEQRAILAARRREHRADRELGPPPVPPQPPKGVYIHGSVGSGKSLVMDMFYGTVAEQELLPYHRRVHFNAAMLEMHSWLTKIDRHLGSAAFSGEGDIDYKAIEGIEDSFQGELQHGRDNGRNAVIALRRATRALALNPRQQMERLARSNASVIRHAPIPLPSIHAVD
mmetsp:Transcript_2165/g.6410  ORF Transcript_2165/g.6410 Transcript_2165/m.6410 type:complete len:412 (+) Transcript_2165:52-1287(+)